MNEQVVETLGSLLMRHPNAVALNLLEVGVDVPPNADAQDLEEIIFLNRNNSDMIQTLSAMILVDAQYDEDEESEFDSFFKGKNKKGGEAINVETGSTLATETGGEAKTKTNFFKKLGGGFKNLFGKKNDSGTDEGIGDNPKKEGSGVGNWLKDNSKQILDIGQGLLGNLFNKKSNTGGGGVDSTGGTDTALSPNTSKKQLSVGAKIGIGAGILGVVGLTIFLIRRR
tara:strand:+ start:174 stop:854 length:681 start_codon:yes stop_codon:yes gene_type:complete